MQPATNYIKQVTNATGESTGQQDELPPAVVVEGAEEVPELRQQRGEVPAGRRQGGEGAQHEAHREHGRRRQHDDISSLVRVVARCAGVACARARAVSLAPWRGERL